MPHSLLDKETEPVTDRTKENVIVAGIAAIIVTLFLFFIDEGYYNFKWMLHGGNWLAFIIYVVVLFPVMFVIGNFVFKKFNVWIKILLLILSGFFISWLIIFAVTKLV